MDYEYNQSDEKGAYRWATVGGKRIKIYEKLGLAESMKQSGKFKKEDKETTKKVEETPEETHERYKKVFGESGDVQLATDRAKKQFNTDELEKYKELKKKEKEYTKKSFHKDISDEERIEAIKEANKYRQQREKMLLDAKEKLEEGLPKTPEKKLERLPVSERKQIDITKNIDYPSEKVINKEVDDISNIILDDYENITDHDIDEYISESKASYFDEESEQDNWEMLYNKVYDKVQSKLSENTNEIKKKLDNQDKFIKEHKYIQENLYYLDHDSYTLADDITYKTKANKAIDYSIDELKKTKGIIDELEQYGEIKWIDTSKKSISTYLTIDTKMLENPKFRDWLDNTGSTPMGNDINDLFEEYKKGNLNDEIEIRISDHESGSHWTEMWGTVDYNTGDWFINTKDL